jgi:hemerythrin superfamily protein
MTDQEIQQLMCDQMKIDTTDSIVNFLDLQLLEEIAEQQMMFPAWRRANPERTRQLEGVLYRLKKVEEERHERCTRFAKELGRRMRAEDLGFPPADRPKLTLLKSGED